MQIVKSKQRRRKIQRAITLSLAAIFGATLGHSSPLRRDYPLDMGWEFRQADSGSSGRVPQWKPAHVPGDVHLDLLKNGLIADPFYRDNVTRLQWIEEADWEYRDTIRADAEMLARRNIDLVFDGLDTNAQVFLNGTPVLNADNMYREWRVNVKPYLRPGENTLRVVFPSPIREAAKIASTDAWRNKTQAPTPEKTYLRKAAYEYGWDWGPRLVTSGIWRAVRLEAWDDARISDFYVRQKDIRPELAHLSVLVEVAASAAGNATIQVEADRGSRPQSYTQNARLHTGVNYIEVPVEIVKPDLWYPAGYGAQPLYKFTATLKLDGREMDSVSVRTGLRSVVLRRDVDQWGRSFEFEVNGIPVFAKGASVIPFDSFPNRVSTADYRRILQSAHDANMNMVRQWGGGYYESDEFYDQCDELGIMVWQDFMFGNEWQPGTYAFKQNVRKEVEYQVRRLRNHPSIALWGGNNETEASWEWPRTVDMTRNDPEIGRRMWQNYLTLFSGVVAETVERLNPETPFWPSSPSADYEDTSGDFIMPGEANLASPQTYMSGDMHNYGIHTPEGYERFFPRFLSEYGWLSYPDPRTIETFTVPADRVSTTTPVMLAHQDTPNGNADILREVRRRYGEPKDLNSLIYLSQLAQAEWVKTGAEHLRRNRPRTMGSLFWQLNDCWPVASLSSIDYFGRWKALQYYARRFYSPLLISPHIEDGSLTVYVVSDRLTDVSARIRLRIMRPDGTILSEATQMANVPALSSAIYIKIPMGTIEKLSAGELGNVFSAADLTVGEKVISQNLLYFTPTSDQRFPKPIIHSQLVREGGSYKLLLSSTVLARGVYVTFGQGNVRMEDNYFDLLPNEERAIGVAGNADIQQLRNDLRVSTLEDALASAPTSSASTRSAPE